MTKPEEPGEEKKFDAEQLFPLVGAAALSLVVILLLSTPSMILAKQVRLIGTDLNRASENEYIVSTRLDFGDAEHVQAFPRNIGDWRGMGFNTSRAAKALGADAMILRQYGKLKWTNGTLVGDSLGVTFAIIQSNRTSAFHNPTVCYTANGYEIEEVGTEEILVSNLTWTHLTAQSQKIKIKTASGDFNGSIPISVKKLVVFKQTADGKVTDREVLLYFYVKGNPLSSDDSITIIRAAADAPLNGSVETALTPTKEFMGEAFHHMFEIQGEAEEIIAVQLANSGTAGWLILAVLVFVPIGVIVYPRVRKRLK